MWMELLRPQGRTPNRLRRCSLVDEFLDRVVRPVPCASPAEVCAGLSGAEIGTHMLFTELINSARGGHPWVPRSLRRMKNMKIGIVGAGQIGGTLTRRLTALGHKVFVANSRGPE